MASIKFSKYDNFLIIKRQVYLDSIRPTESAPIWTAGLLQQHDLYPTKSHK